MKHLLIAAGVAVVAGALYYFSLSKVGKHQVINVEDGMPITT